MAPSPTADAQRFTDPCRTSPAAKTPGTFVSRYYGLLSNCQLDGRPFPFERSGPVTR
jgi:hypothetical protein